MTAEGFKRKLTAILSADVEGYSRLMSEDEEATVRTLTTYREVMTTLIQQHNGKVLDSPGDNLLAEFASVVDAVQCAVSVQKEINARNAELAEDRRMQFRIGINLGDVIQEEDRIYGDGVNIAARLEGLAEPGGICISKTAFDHIESKLPYGYEYLGDQTVKNIPKPVGAYRVLMEPRVTVAGMPEKPAVSRRMPIVIGATVVIVLVIALGIWYFFMRPAQPPIETASVEKMAYPLPDKPSIAVLPFANMSGDPEQEYLSDGLSEEIITALSKLENLFVIARNSSFTYKGKPIKVQQVGRELGVKYVLEGSVRKSVDRVRITAQLVDAKTGNHLWADRYDRKLEDIFVLQDEITKKILTALQVKLTEGERIRLWSRSTDNLDAFQKYLKGRVHYLRFNPDDNAIAKQLFEEAIALDPEFAEAIAGLAWIHLMDISFGASKSPKESFERAAQLTQKANSLDKSLATAYYTLGWISMKKGQFKEAIALAEKGVALSPGDSPSMAMLSAILSGAGRHEEALSLIKKAIRLDPIPLPWYFSVAGDCYFRLGRYEEAIEEYEKVLHRNQNNLTARIRITAAYSLLGREEEASASASEVLRINPKFSVNNHKKSLSPKNKKDLEQYTAALRKAGLPE